MKGWKWRQMNEIKESGSAAPSRKIWMWQMGEDLKKFVITGKIVSSKLKYFVSAKMFISLPREVMAWTVTSFLNFALLGLLCLKAREREIIYLTNVAISCHLWNLDMHHLKRKDYTLMAAASARQHKMTERTFIFF